MCVIADPELKARVEAATGVSVPSASPCCDQANQTQSSPCTAQKVFGVALTIVLSFVIVRIAAGVTLHIANDLVYFEDDGTEVIPSPLFVLLIFIGVLSAQLLVLCGIKKALVFFSQRRAAAANVSTACSGTQPPSDGTSGSSGVRRFLPSFSSTRFFVPSMPSFLQRRDARGSYEPLMSDESTTELIVTSAPSAPQQHLIYVPPPAYTVAAPVAAHEVRAQSLSSFSML